MMARKKKYPEGKPMLGVGALNDLNPKNNNFVIEIRGLINSNPQVLADPNLMGFLRLALFRANAGENISNVAKELDDELSDYLVKNNFQAPAGVRKLQAALKPYTESL